MKCGGVVILIMLLMQGALRAQCDCLGNFEFVYAKTKLNYAGWTDKTTGNQRQFEEFTSVQRMKARAESQKNYCYKIIQDWLNYFRDHHTHLYSKAPGPSLTGKSEQEIRDLFSQTEKIEITDNRVDPASGIEGIWQMEGSNYRLAIVKNKTQHRDYAGVILEADSVYWVPGQIKMELTQVSQEKFSTLFYMRDHSMRMTTATLDHHELRIEGLNTLRRINAEQEAKQTSVRESISNQVELKKINASTFYFRLPTFNHHVKNKVDSLLQENHDGIAGTPNLILDVRDNGGGSDVTYAGLIQYVYTNKITVVNNSIWSSPDNIQKFENILNDPEYPGSGKGYLRSLIKRLKENPGSFVKKEDNVIRKLRSLPAPKNVIILINSGCASSCEEFILAARQSKKVVLMGTNTMGVLDYANVHQLQMPCESWGLQYATSRTNRLPEFPIDNIGIEPAIRIPENTNWVAFAAEYLKSR